jgi:hypothetical protein
MKRLCAASALAVLLIVVSPSTKAATLMPCSAAGGTGGTGGECGTLSVPLDRSNPALG